MSDQYRPPLARDAVETQSEREAREARHQVLIELLAAYADRELPAETTSQIDAHLVGCARCRSELAVHQGLLPEVPERSVGRDLTLRMQIEYFLRDT